MSDGTTVHPFDVCNGYTYELESLTYPSDIWQNPVGTAFTSTDFDTCYSPTTQGTTANPKYDCIFPDFQWVGTHTMKIIGKLGYAATAGLYIETIDPANSDPITQIARYVETAIFTVVISNPCDSSTVTNSWPSYFYQTTTVMKGSAITWYYSLPTDSESDYLDGIASTDLDGNGLLDDPDPNINITYIQGSGPYTQCGPRSYYIEVKNRDTTIGGSNCVSNCSFTIKVDEDNSAMAPYLLWKYFPLNSVHDWPDGPGIDRSLDYFGL